MLKLHLSAAEQRTRITDILSYRNGDVPQIYLSGSPLIVNSVDAAPMEEGGRLRYASLLLVIFVIAAVANVTSRNIYIYIYIIIILFSIEV